MAACDKIIANLDQQIATGKQLADICKNPGLKKKILDAIAVLEEEKHKLQDEI